MGPGGLQSLVKASLPALTPLLPLPAGNTEAPKSAICQDHARRAGEDLTPEPTAPWLKVGVADRCQLRKRRLQGMTGATSSAQGPQSREGRHRHQATSDGPHRYIHVAVTGRCTFKSCSRLKDAFSHFRFGRARWPLRSGLSAPPTGPAAGRWRPDRLWSLPLAPQAAQQPLVLPPGPRLPTPATLVAERWQGAGTGPLLPRSGSGIAPRHPTTLPDPTPSLL